MNEIKNWQTTHEIFALGAVIAKNAIQAAERHGVLADAGISMLQYRVLHRLRHGNQTIAELSKVMMVDPSTLVSVVDTLTRKGLAERRRDPNDRRRLPIAITEHGLSVLSAHPAHGPFTADNPLVKSLQALGEEKAQQLLLLLREVVLHMPDGPEMLQHIANRVEYHKHDMENQHKD